MQLLEVNLEEVEKIIGDVNFFEFINQPNFHQGM
jgi:hypothetical protein